MLNGEFEKALESYTKALELDPDNKCCLVARSKCYLHIGDPMKALKVSIFQSTINSSHMSNYGWVRPYGSNNGSLRCRLSRKIWARGTQTCAPASNRPCSPKSVTFVHIIWAICLAWKMISPLSSFLAVYFLPSQGSTEWSRVRFESYRTTSWLSWSFIAGTPVFGEPRPFRGALIG